MSEKFANQESLEKAARDLNLRAEASKRASADPLPGPLANAFGPLSLKVCGMEVRPLVAYDWAIMKSMNAPIYRQMLEWMQNQDHPEKADLIEFTDQEGWELIFLLTRSCEEADEVFEKGKQAFSRAARREIGMKLHTAQVSLLAEACLKQIQAHMETMVKYTAEAEEKKEGEGVPLPFLTSAGMSPATASAGG